MHQIPGLYFKETEHKGRGVFCLHSISKDDIIEICPVIILEKEDCQLIHGTRLHDYYFIWDEAGGSCAIALGFGSLYNHSANPNAGFRIDAENHTIDIFCIENIEEGEEITLDYHEGLRDQKGLWFDVAQD